MISRLRGICKALWYKICHGKNFDFEGIPKFESRARINLIKGSVQIGKGLSMKPNAYCAITDDGRLQMGKGVSIGRNTVIVCHEQISIGEGCAIAPNVAIYDHDHKFGAQGIEEGFKTAPVVIEKNCWIGVGTIILRGTHIGEGSVIGAGCVVQGEIPAHSLVTSDRSLHIRNIENNAD